MFNYSVIIPVVYKDYSFLGRSVEYVINYLNPDVIYIITDIRMARFLPRNVKNNIKCRVIDENHLCPNLTYHKVDSILHNQGRSHTKTGWYFQQFLKMGFAKSEYCDTDYYLSWDSDTIPLKSISFFDDEAHPYFTMKSEYHEPYFQTMEKILSIGKTNRYSYIAEHMMFNKQVMIELLSKIVQSDVEGGTWFEKIIKSLAPEKISPFSFSEFETYGTYCKSFYPELYRERHLSGFRKAGLIQGRLVSDRILENLAEEVDVASFEIYDRPPFPWGLICHWYEEIMNYRERALRFLLK